MLDLVEADKTVDDTTRGNGSVKEKLNALAGELEKQTGRTQNN
jgi:hypothetical protein